MGYEELVMFIKDGIKFVENFAGIIDKSTPHLYLSALPFSPSKSVLARSQIARFAGIAQVAVGQQDDWPRNQQVFQGHTFSVNTVAFSPDGRHIVSGSGDKTIRLWDAQTGAQVANPLQGHTSSVTSVTFSPDGRHIVSCSWDQTIRLWDAQTGSQVCEPLQGHTSSVWSVAFSPDGRYIVSGSEDRTIRLWDAQICGHWVGNALKEKTINSLLSTLSPIHFSSSAAHALHDAQSLFVDMSNVNADYRDLIHLQNDGWIVGPKGKLLLWVPPSYHKLFLYTPWTHLVIPRGNPELNLSKMAHGPAWHGCYTPVPEDTN